MSDNSTLVIIAAIAAVAPTATVVATWQSTRRKVAVVEAKVDTVHQIANSRLTEALSKIESLTTLVAQLRGGSEDHATAADAEVVKKEAP